MAKRTGLGKGLGAIFGDEVMESAAEEQELKNQQKQEAAILAAEKKEEERDLETGREMFLKLSSIEPNHDQPRMDFREESLLEQSSNPWKLH